AGDRPRGGPAKQKSEAAPEAGPEHGPRDVEQGEPEPRDAKRAGHGRQNRRKPGQELREQHRPDAKPEKEVLRPPHTYVRLERESTQPRQDLRSAPPPQLVPREIDGQGCDHDRADHEPQVDAPRRRERARREQRRNRRPGNTKLFRQGGHWEEGFAVSLEPGQQGFRVALAAGGSWDSFGRRGGFSPSREESSLRFGQLTLEVLHLLSDPFSGLGARRGFPTCRFGLLRQAFALSPSASLPRRCFITLAPFIGHPA